MFSAIIGNTFPGSVYLSQVPTPTLPRESPRRAALAAWRPRPRRHARAEARRLAGADAQVRGASRGRRDCDGAGGGAQAEAPRGKRGRLVEDNVHGGPARRRAAPRAHRGAGALPPPRGHRPVTNQDIYSPLLPLDSRHAAETPAAGVLAHRAHGLVQRAGFSPSSRAKPRAVGPSGSAQARALSTKKAAAAPTASPVTAAAATEPPA
jgi:hypothetical protein